MQFRPWFVFIFLGMYIFPGKSFAEDPYYDALEKYILKALDAPVADPDFLIFADDFVLPIANEEEAKKRAFALTHLKGIDSERALYLLGKTVKSDDHHLQYATAYALTDSRALRCLDLILAGLQRNPRPLGTRLLYYYGLRNFALWRHGVEAAYRHGLSDPDETLRAMLFLDLAVYRLISGFTTDEIQKAFLANGQPSHSPNQPWLFFDFYHYNILSKFYHAGKSLPQSTTAKQILIDAAAGAFHPRENTPRGTRRLWNDWIRSNNLGDMIDFDALADAAYVTQTDVLTPIRAFVKRHAPLNIKQLASDYLDGELQAFYSQCGNNF